MSSMLLLTSSSIQRIWLPTLATVKKKGGSCEHVFDQVVLCSVQLVLTLYTV